jgi:hypothetical protein
MKVFKGYVRNPNRPEGYIAENYIAEEAIEFCSEFLNGMDPIGVPSKSKLTPDDMVVYGPVPRGGDLTQVDRRMLEKAHHYVLQNTEDVEPYIE